MSAKTFRTPELVSELTRDAFEGASARPPRKIYVSHPPGVWEKARARYLAGRTAGQVAAELGVSISAVRLQASRGGWTRRDVRAREAAEDAGGGAGGFIPLGEGRFDPPLLASEPEGRRPRHLRLDAEAWAVIRGRRLRGETITTLAAAYGVSEGTIRRHAKDEGWRNTDLGGAASRAIVEMEIAGRAFADGRAAAERDAAAQALDEAEPEPEADPLEAARLPLRRAAGMAEAGRLAQAAERVKLAEGLARAVNVLDPPQRFGDDEDPMIHRVLTREEWERLRDTLVERCARFDDDPAGEGVGAEA